MKKRKEPPKSSPSAAKKKKDVREPMEHFKRLLSDSQAEGLLDKNSLPETRTDSTAFGRIHTPNILPTSSDSPVSMEDVKSSLRENLLGDWEPENPLWQSIHSYQDLHYPVRPASGEGIDSLIEMLCVHVLNHALKLRSKILANNEKLAKEPKGADLEIRDQGLTRPKTLILLPFRSSALRYVEVLSRLMFGKATKEFVTNKKRFMDEFAVGETETASDKPKDFQELFAGNSDDCFRLGIGIAKKSLKLFVDFYSADIIIASPLGLRMAIGAKGESSHEYDFLSSIQILILDQTDVFLMQNWSHVLHIFDHLHRQPKESHGTDFGRVHLWELNGWASLYRQTILLSSRPTPELRALHSRFGRNHKGLAEWSPKFRAQGVLPAVSPSINQVFYRFSAPDLESASDARFEFFLSKILPRFLNTGLSHTCIFVPSYLDYVRLRNHFKRETLGAVQVSEYTKTAKIARARDLFFHGQKPFLLYSERAHFFKRHHIRGIRQIIFYQLPVYAEFYSEILDLIAETAESATEPIQPRALVLFSTEDALRLAPLVGPVRAKSLIVSADSTFVISAS